MKACNSCGRCCQIYGGSRLAASTDEISWWQQTRPDIAEFIRNGQLWVSPTTGRALTTCPWLEPPAPGSKAYTCAIYNDRPDECRQYPSRIDEMVRDECEMIQPADLADEPTALARLRVLQL